MRKVLYITILHNLNNNVNIYFSGIVAAEATNVHLLPNAALALKISTAQTIFCYQFKQR